MPCELWFILGLASVFAVGALVVHHFVIHGEGSQRLEGFDRVFQPRDVFVCCMFQRPWRQRCAHECWIVIFVVIFIICYYQLQLQCND